MDSVVLKYIYTVFDKIYLYFVDSLMFLNNLFWIDYISAVAP